MHANNLREQASSTGEASEEMEIVTGGQLYMDT
jgi:hypothetical protein